MENKLKNKQRLVVCIMGQNCDRFIDMCYESIKDADDIVFCDGGSSDGTIDYLKSKGFKWTPGPRGKKTMIFNRYDQLDKAMNGKQRNFYLKYLKKNYPNDWCLCLDADEVVENLSSIKEFIKMAHFDIYSVMMRHLIGDLAHEDATQKHHFVLHRLFRINAVKDYPEVEHPVLQPIDDYRTENTNCTTIWHMAYVPNLWEIKKRYDNHLIKSNMHTPEYLKNWYMSHIFGSYPKKQFNPVELPSVILDKFGIDKDFLYFQGRQGVEVKHFIECLQWKKHFNLKSCFFAGCGFGQRVHIMKELDVIPGGIEISEYAVNNSMARDRILCADICDFSFSLNDDIDPVEDLTDEANKDYNKFVKEKGGEKFDLAVAYDILEHLKYEDLDVAIENMINSSKKHILISIPFKGTPNCEADPTHIIKEDRDWWISKFKEKNCKLIKTPDHFLFKEQLLIFEVNK